MHYQNTALYKLRIMSNNQKTTHCPRTQNKTYDPACIVVIHNLKYDLKLSDTQELYINLPLSL